jgi:hypothetical protein
MESTSVHECYQKKEQLWNMGNDQWQQSNKTKKCKLKWFIIKLDLKNNLTYM